MIERYCSCPRFAALLTAASFAGAGPAAADIVDAPHIKVAGIVVVWGAEADGSAPVVNDFIVDQPGPSDTDLISGDVRSVVTGTLLSAFDSSSLDEVQSRIFTVRGSPSGNGTTDSNGNGVTDGADRFDAFAIGQSTRLGLDDSLAFSSFYVASNTAFNIDGQSRRVVGRNDSVMRKIYWDMEVTQSGSDEINFGSRAQLPHSAGSTGGIGSVPSLYEMRTQTTLFTGDQRTARQPGSIVDQSVRFDVTYTLGSWSGYSLSTRHTNLAEGIYEVEAEVVYTVWVP